ncbi:MAG: hypothetical protein AB1611_09120 [bacterium]
MSLILLASIMKTLLEISQSLLVIFPIHPRTQHRLQGLGIRTGRKGSVPPLWDGKASERIAAIVEQWA